MKMNYIKINKDIYSIPIKNIKEISYNKSVYDISVEENSPNFITKGNLLIHNSTRANILDTLYERNYIKEKSIQATALGIRLIDTLKKFSPVIIDEKLTREIEKDMDIIRGSKKDLDKKQKTTVNLAEQALTKISNDFKKNELAIGKELIEADGAMWEQQKQDNKLGMKCPNCNAGELTIKFTPKFRSYFIACTNYPECKQTYPLPKNSLIKKAENNKLCEACSWPMLLSIKKAKKPWLFCFNPNCPKRKEKQENNSSNNNVD